MNALTHSLRRSNAGWLSEALGSLGVLPSYGHSIASNPAPLAGLRERRVLGGERGARQVVRCVVLSLAVVAGSVSAAPRTYDVYLDDAHIGEHVFTFEREDNGHLVARSEARFDIRVLRVPVFRYRHTATERWDGPCLSTIESDTEVNGDRHRLRGRRNADHFLLDVSHDDDQEHLRLPHCVSTFAYWSPETLASHTHLLNNQTGAYEPVALTADSAWSRLEGPSFAIDLRYRDGAWTELRTLRDGRALEYRLRQPPLVEVASN